MKFLLCYETKFNFVVFEISVLLGNFINSYYQRKMYLRLAHFKRAVLPKELLYTLFGPDVQCSWIKQIPLFEEIMIDMRVISAVIHKG